MFGLYMKFAGWLVAALAWFGWILPHGVSVPNTFVFAGTILLTIFVVVPFLVWSLAKLVRGMGKVGKIPSQKGIGRAIGLILLAVAMSLQVGCKRATVPPGYVGVKVNLYGSQKGVSEQTIGTGRYWINPFYEEIYQFPTFSVTYPFTKTALEGSPQDEAFYFQNKDGIKCDVDIGINAYANSDLAATLFQKYRQDMNSIIKNFIRNELRNLFVKYTSNMSLEDMYGTNKVVLIMSVERDLKEKMAPFGLVIDTVYYLSDIRFPVDVENAIVAKISATQKAVQRENEVAEATAAARKIVEAAKGEANANIERAKGEAEANRIKAASISPDILAWQALQNAKLFIERWNGTPPQFMGSGAIPLFNMGDVKPVGK